MDKLTISINPINKLSVGLNTAIINTEKVLQSKTVVSSSTTQTVTYDSGYDGLSSVTITPMDNADTTRY